LLDEPLSALDAKNRKYLRHQIKSIHKKTGITTIYVTHDQEEALSMSDLIIVMNKGHIEQIGTPQQVYHRPTSLFVARFMGEGSTIPFQQGNLSQKSIETLFPDQGDEEAILFFRPEHVYIEIPKSTIPSTLLPHITLDEAKLISSEFLGDRYLLQYQYYDQIISAYSKDSVEQEMVNLLVPLKYLSLFPSK
jgi:ABC-type Fe3+/spermidine/putrescine transport system ATPase subunit